MGNPGRGDGRGTRAEEGGERLRVGSLSTAQSPHFYTEERIV